ncbi:hypothetical protein [Rhodococcus sp. NPDC058521]|uniref:hypothetical protein n=1 Tax=Rhodococcus sp. NPDC058521 TaxID=3346536 RepID=UPI00365BAC39
MQNVSDIRIARNRTPRRVLFLGAPGTSAEATRWAMVKGWLQSEGILPVRRNHGEVLCVIASEDVLDGMCSPIEAAALQRARELGTPCIGIHESAAIWDLTAPVRPRRQSVGA